jgi:hypothetical protein
LEEDVLERDGLAPVADLLEQRIDASLEAFACEVELSEKRDARPAAAS